MFCEWPRGLNFCSDTYERPREVVRYERPIALGINAINSVMYILVGSMTGRGRAMVTVRR